MMIHDLLANLYFISVFFIVKKVEPSNINAFIQSSFALLRMLWKCILLKKKVLILLICKNVYVKHEVVLVAGQVMYIVRW